MRVRRIVVDMLLMHIFAVIGIMGMLGEYVVKSMLGNGYEGVQEFRTSRIG